MTKIIKTQTLFEDDKVSRGPNEPWRGENETSSNLVKTSGNLIPVNLFPANLNTAKCGKSFLV